VDSLNEEVNDIYLKKIEFCTQKFSEFMLHNECNKETFQQLISSCAGNKLNLS
jgi:hypothetical protein